MTANRDRQKKLHAARQAKLRDKYRENGWTRREYWATPDEHTGLTDLLNRTRKCKQ